MRKIITAIVFAGLLLTGCTASAESSEKDDTAEITGRTDYEEDTWDDSSAVHITLNGTEAETDGSGVSVDDGAVTITKAGTYVLAGSYTGTVLVNNSSKSIVHLILNGVSITSADGPAVSIEKGDTVITLADGSENTLADSEAYSDQSEDAPSACLYAKDDLAVNGSGSLTVDANYNDGITTRDSFYLYNGTITIQAEDDGIVARDAFLMKAGELIIDAGGDGIKTTNEDEDKGSLQIDGGTLSITAGDDGIETIHDLLINEGTIRIETTGSAADDQKAKGFSIGGAVTINGGTIDMDTADDAINAAGDISINNGTFTLKAGDDGIHSDQSLIVNGGTIDITNSYEGLEAKYITINDGVVTIASSDDGINTADPSFTGNMMAADTSSLAINGGTITVDADGDGIDMNGCGEMNGGSVTIYGPERDMDGALDYSGTFTVNGGTLLAGGSSGMAQFPSDGSSASTIVIGTNGGTISIQDASGTVLATYQSAKTYSLLSFTADQLEEGTAYTVYEDGNILGTVTIDSSIVYVNYSASNRGFGPGSNQGQRGRQGV